MTQGPEQCDAGVGRLSQPAGTGVGVFHGKDVKPHTIVTSHICFWVLLALGAVT